MFRVALTGGIATGKTHVRRRFETLGVETVDADRLVHDALGSGTPTTASVAERFGNEVLAPDGSVDRRRLGNRVFADAEARRDLERLLHPAVYRAIASWFDARARASAALAIADIPLLYETGREGDFDAVIVAACAAAEQIRRVMARDGLSAEAAHQRVAAQLPIDEKVQRADYVIWTTGALAETDGRVDEVCEALKQRARKRGQSPFS